MKVVRSRRYTINLGEFENIVTEVSLELDLNGSSAEALTEDETLRTVLDAALDGLLAGDIALAQEIGRHGRSFVFTNPFQGE